MSVMTQIWTIVTLDLLKNTVLDDTLTLAEEEMCVKQEGLQEGNDPWFAWAANLVEV